MGQPLSDTEALLWSIGRDPNLATTMGLVAILDRKPDIDRLRTTLASTVAAVERLQQRVVAPALEAGNGLARPEWIIDHQFDFDFHVRSVRLATPGAASEADLRLAAARFINDPFDLTRPLWQFQIVTGLARGRAALIGKVHHSISDGIGLLRLAGNLLEFEPDADPPEPVDLATLLAEAGRSEEETGSNRSAKSGAERLIGWLQSAADGLPNPGRLMQVGAEAVASARTIGEQLPKSKASELWATRSRNRRLEFHTVALPSLRDQAQHRGVSINDLFVAACAQAAVHYHDRFGVELPTITATVVVSTEPSAADGELGGAGDNAFIPVAIELPGTSATADDRLELVNLEVARRRAELAERADGLQAISALSGLVPASVAASLAVRQAAKVDFATSNIPGPPIPAWLAGQPVRSIHPVGPVAGTAFNVTLITLDQQAHLGIHLDPAAVTDAAILQRSIGQGFADFGVSRR